LFKGWFDGFKVVSLLGARGFSLAAALLAVVWTLYAGKDLNWDLLHYHYYVAYAFLNGGLERDYFAASAQSYLNPLGYLPFYWMVSAGWHSAVVSAVLALVHAANIVLLYLLASRLFADQPPRERALLSALGAALGAAGAVFAATVGTSFLDPLLTVPMLGAVLLLAGEGGMPAPRRAALAGLLFGAAAALKYSNALFALAALPLLGLRWRALAAYAAGGTIAVAALAGPTVVALWRAFGNPFFPLFNGWFRSPDFPPINIGAERFAPRGLGDALLFPLRILSPDSMTYAEISAPDLRFAALVLLALGLLALAIARRVRPAGAPGRALAPLDLRLAGFFAAAYALWLATSGNARYGLLLLLLAGPLAALLAARLLGRYARGALLVLLVAQVTACALISPTRYFMVDRWSERWFGWQVPERARREAALYLTIETQSMAAVAPFLHPDSSFVNLRGQHSLEQGAKRLRALEARHAGRVRTLGRALRLQRDGRPRAETVENYDATLLRYGFRVDPDDCFAIPWRPRRDDAVSGFANLLVTEDSSLRPPPLALVSCGLRPGAWSAEEQAEEQRMSTLFDRMERSCPGVFRGQTAVTERMGSEWSRNYAGLEARLETRGGALALAPFFELRHFPLGRVEDWENGVPAPLAEACREGLRR
jgi:hypothetical protein